MDTVLQSFFLTSPHENGFLTFVLGAIFVLTVYHFLLFFQHKDKSYIYYSLYTFILFITYFSFTKNDFLDTITLPVKNFFNLSHLAWVWVYNILYFFFAFHFLKMDSHYKKQTNVIRKILYLLFLLAVVSFVVTLYTGSNSFLTAGYTFVFLPIIIAVTFYSFYLIYRIPERIKYYILIGSFVLFVSSVLATFIIDFGLISENKEAGFLIFYTGVVIENICFSLGLGYKQKLIIKERDSANKKLIFKLQENEILKEKVHQQLQEKVNVLSQQINLKQQIEDLKLSTLQSQMNPHFLFNALNSIKLYIINNDQKNAASYLTKFSKLIRKILEASSLKETSLAEELTTINLYMSLENIRFSDEIDFEITVKETVNLERIKIPPLVLQPFLENAIWHGLSSKKGKKIISLCIEKSNTDFVQISITDNGIGRASAAKIKSNKTLKRKSIGIDLTKERLKNFVKNLQASFSINYFDLKDDKGIPTGTKVVLKIPLL